LVALVGCSDDEGQVSAGIKGMTEKPDTPTWVTSNDAEERLHGFVEYYNELATADGDTMEGLEMPKSIESGESYFLRNGSDYSITVSVDDNNLEYTVLMSEDKGDLDETMQALMMVVATLDIDLEEFGNDLADNAAEAYENGIYVNEEYEYMIQDAEVNGFDDRDLVFWFKG